MMPHLLFYPWNFCLFASFINQTSFWSIYHIGGRDNTIYSEILETFFSIIYPKYLLKSQPDSLKIVIFIQSLPGPLFLPIVFQILHFVFFIMTTESQQPGSRKLWMLVYSFNKYFLKAFCVVHSQPFSSTSVLISIMIFSMIHRVIQEYFFFFPNILFLNSNLFYPGQRTCFIHQPFFEVVELSLVM